MRIRPDPFARGDGLMEEEIEDNPRGTAVVGQQIGLLDLAENLALADDLGIETGSDAQQVDHAVFPFVRIEIIRPDVRLFVQQGQEEILQHVSCRTVGTDCIDFTAVARREDDRFLDCIVLAALRQGSADAFRWYSELLPHGNRDRLVIQAPDE